MDDWKSALSGLRDLLPEGEEPPSRETPPTASDNSRKKEKLTVTIERKGRGGKTATIIFGFTSSEEIIAELASELRHTLGTGGSSRGGEILLQGDVREKVKSLLKEKGYRL